MKYGKPLSQRDIQQAFHKLCKAAADDLAEGKSHILQLEAYHNHEAAMAQIRVFLCTCYGFSANGSSELIEKHLQVSISQNLSCVSGRIHL